MPHHLDKECICHHLNKEFIAVIFIMMRLCLWYDGMVGINTCYRTHLIKEKFITAYCRTFIR